VAGLDRASCLTQLDHSGHIFTAYVVIPQVYAIREAFHFQLSSMRHWHNYTEACRIAARI
jgi:hypothetical protein